MSNFDYAFNEVIEIEGGFVNNKNDNGGKTNYGITQALADIHNFNVETITKEQAKMIYKKEFWDKSHLDLIQDKEVAKEVFEFGVNSGMLIAVKVLQRSYNTLNKENVLTEDGLLGRITAGKINNFKSNTLLKTQNIFQGMFYIGLAEDDKFLLTNLRHHKETKGSQKYKTFIKGWINKRISFEER